MEKTISAIATPQGAGGIGIIRISGDRALSVADAVFHAVSKAKLSELPGMRALYGTVVDRKGTVIDEAVALVFRAPHSYTAEDVVELQCHGGSAVLRRVLARTYEGGAAPAERGEFTKRAFLNGRLDLTQAAAVMDVVNAKTDAALKIATGHLTGRFSDAIQAMRRTLLEEIAHIEAAIDFPEDEIEDVLLCDVRETMNGIRAEIAHMQKTATAGRILREGLTTAIVGKPNVGKSSLLNALLREERAIVTEIPGTTRDAIEEYAEVGGIPLHIIDTAGIREAKDEVERIGIEKARDHAESAALVLALFDASRPLSDEDQEILAFLASNPAKGMALLTKADLPAVLTEQMLREKIGGVPILSLSAKTGEGLEWLAETIAARVYEDVSESDASIFVSTEREAEILRETDAYLFSALHAIEDAIGLDFISIDLRAAWEALGRLMGDTVGEDILDEIFSKFCLGK